ncbi:similar to Saccharomyces cerevisiae YOL053W AIM39 Putative protein of unknown function [Maudiozyma barnettii]|uniref:Altered inheritance of mitochondria protein 39, mitochondrial n=1 Tax=Maudiozyma barnettii TaxID=61262 RepID=A0A8H2ZG43_9SACH|nr:Aim39p [Kazachstania barnettii]CAB4252949.1 similar to Saccharomyces cerevisiae YOL053W AIM39 Putative protein of unknown function [Kazachstania barnettii]CAD1780744.1 similar to Saccharomyces cerevisiae YOL053W AIM39 Putative protein of unknown function [Kazachstania barnettii]
MLKRLLLRPRVVTSTILRPRIQPVIISRNFNLDSIGLWKKKTDAKHFFSRPEEDLNANINKEIMESYRRMQNKKRLQTGMIIISSLIITIIGYQVCFKVMYLKRDAFIALWPSPYKIHPLTETEKQYLDIPYMKMIVKKRTIEKVVRNEFIREEYGVPLKVDMHDDNKQDQFKVWSEDEDLVIYGIKFRPNRANRSKRSNDNWHGFLGLFQWRFSVRSVNLIQILEDFSSAIGIRLDKITIPERRYGSFKNEYPIHDNDYDDFENGTSHDRRRHICFIGKFALNDNSTIIYKGKYHVETRFDEIYLMREEDGKFVKYLIYKENF